MTNEEQYDPLCGIDRQRCEKTCYAANKAIEWAKVRKQGGIETTPAELNEHIRNIVWKPGYRKPGQQMGENCPRRGHPIRYRRP